MRVEETSGSVLRKDRLSLTVVPRLDVIHLLFCLMQFLLDAFELTLKTVQFVVAVGLLAEERVEQSQG